MQYTKSTNTDPYKAIYGTKGSDVLGLQQQLNKLGAGLKEDSLYGPMTQSAYEKYKSQLTPTTTQAPTNTATGNTQTIGSMFQIPTLSTPTTQETDYLAMQDKLAKGEDIVDTSAIRSKTLADFQDRINAINQVYAGKLAEAKQQGVGRVGQTTSILANRGLAGSLRGGAINEQTLTQNREIEDAINQEKALALSAIYNDVNSTAQAEAQRRREAMQSGAKNYIEFIKGQDTRKQTNISSVATALLAQGIDPSTLTPEEMTNITGKINATSGDIISAYKKLKTDEELKRLKEQPSISEKYGTGTIGEYNFAKSQGYTGSFTDYQNEDANRKKSIARAGVSGSGGKGGIYDILDYRTANAVIAQGNSFGTSDVVKKYNNIVAASNLIKGVNPNTTNPAEHQAVIYNFAKALDPDSVVREGEYATVKKYSQSLFNKYKGEIKQAVAGTGFLSPGAIQAIQEATNNRIKAYEPQYTNLKNETRNRINSIAGKDVADIVLLDYEQGYTGNQADNNNDPDPLGILN